MFCRYAFDFVRGTLSEMDSNYLEIGVFNGDSIAQLAQMFPSKTIVACDPFIEDGCTNQHSGVETGSPMNAQRNSTMSLIKPYTNITFFEMKSSEMLDILTDAHAEELNVGIVLVDGDHHMDNVVVDYKLAMKLIGKKPGYIIFDDFAAEHTEVKFAVAEFKQVFKDRIEGVNLQDHNVPIFKIKAAE